MSMKIGRSTRDRVVGGRGTGKNGVAKLDNLDLNRRYTLKDFECINEQLKTQALVIGGQPVDLLELDASGKLITMPQTPIRKEVVVAKIVGLLDRWNVQTRMNGAITSSQGSFKFETRDGRTIRAPDVAFTPKEVYRTLSEAQLGSFRGRSFTPTFVVEVENVSGGSGAKFRDLDSKFKDVYFAWNTSVQLGWLIDPENQDIWVYKRNEGGTVFRRKKQWGDIDGGAILPGFTLEVELIDEEISQESSESSQSSSSEELEILCPECDESFDERHPFMKHYEREHACKRRRRG